MTFVQITPEECERRIAESFAEQEARALAYRETLRGSALGLSLYRTIVRGVRVQVKAGGPRVTRLGCAALAGRALARHEAGKEGRTNV